MQNQPFITNRGGALPGAIECGLLVMVLLGPVFAQPPSYPCEPPSAVKKVLQRLGPENGPMAWDSRDVRRSRAQRKEEKLGPLRTLLEQFPDDLFLHRRYQESVKGGVFEFDLESLVEQYHGFLKNHSDDPVYLYLLGRLLVGWRTDQAKSYLEKALQQAPGFPWAHLGLVDVYQVPTYRDRQKAQTHLQSFMTLCPSNYDAYGYLNGIDDAEFVSQRAQQLRTQLKGRTDPDTLYNYITLWRLEFRLRPADAHDQVRRQMGEDLRRLRRLDLINDYAWLRLLWEGYRITNDKEGVRWANEQIRRIFPYTSLGAGLVMESWQGDHPRPGEKAPPEEQQTYYRALWPATAAWTRQWPHYPVAWNRRYEAASWIADLPAAEVEAAAEGFLQALEQNPDYMTFFPPAAILVARLYLMRNIGLARVPDLVARGLQEIKARNERGLQMDRYTSERRKEHQETVASRYWIGWPLMLEAHLKSGQRESARDLLFQMEADLDKTKPDASAPNERTRAYAGRQALYWEWMARLAEAENRKMDALTFYQNALLRHPPKSETDKTGLKEAPVDKTRRLWQELGGTNEGWQAWWTRGDTPTLAAKDLQENLWKNVDKPLSDFGLLDRQGRTWRLADIEGKVAFINVWATSCGPCRMELPHVQKVYERLKDRQDVLVLTLNIDDDVTLVEPFLKKNGFTFPVLFGLLYVENMVPDLSIPRSWIIDPKGVLRMEQIGFNPEWTQWEAQVLAMIEKARAGGR